MITLYILFVTYFLLPVALALALGYARKNHFLTDDLRLTNRAYETPIKHIYSTLIWLSIFLVLIFAIYKFLGGDLSASLLAATLILQCGSTLTLTAITFKATSIYKSSPTTFNIIAGLVTAGVVFLSSIYADAHISSTIKIISAELPAAQKALTIALFIIWGAVLLTMIFSVLYLISAVFVFIAGVLKTSKIKAAQNKMLMLSKDNIRTSNHEDNEMVYLAMFIGLAFTTMSTVTVVQLITKNEKFTPFINELVVFASFHFSAIDCLPEIKEPSRLALISNDRIVVATPNEKEGYTFKVEKCDITAAQQTPQG